MKFVADHMLGRLAGWLRLLGFDVLYPKNLRDDELIKIANEQNRILLTRDRKITGKNVFLVRSVFIDRQLEQTVKELKLKIEDEFSRCSICNTEIVEVPKEQVKDIVPERVYKEQALLWKCPNCNRVYWQGSHWKKISKKIEELRI
ncbi:MAG: Mut7-C RNAse domain-containing protein [Candidatus Thermoplasmatota archaeon]|nr:Mut7-C RNAse domain-containing protein [Candidatus Thermoplasmatota archaeon]